MKLLRASFRGLAGVPDATLDLLDPQTGGARDLFVVCGGPASGKTRLLEAIVAAKEAVAPYGMFTIGGGWVRGGAEPSREATVELEFSLDLEERALAGREAPTAKARVVFDEGGATAEADPGLAEVLGRYEHDARAGKIEYLPARRALPPPGPAHGLSSAEQRFSRLSRDADKYSFVSRFLVEIGKGAAAPESDRARFEAALRAIAPDLRFVSDPSDPLRCLAYRGGAPVPPSELGTSAAHAVLIAATAALVRYDRSIVLLDRPEAAVDERAIGAFIRGLRDLGADLQLIVASSSPALRGGFDGRSIYDLARA